MVNVIDDFRRQIRAEADRIIAARKQRIPVMEDLNTASDNTSSQQMSQPDVQAEVQQNAAPEAPAQQPVTADTARALEDEISSYAELARKERLVLLATSIASGFATRDSDPEHIATRSIAIAKAIIAQVEG